MVPNEKLTDDEERAKRAPDCKLDENALLVIRSSVWFGGVCLTVNPQR